MGLNRRGPNKDRPKNFKLPEPPRLYPLDEHKMAAAVSAMKNVKAEAPSLRNVKKVTQTFQVTDETIVVTSHYEFEAEPSWTHVFSFDRKAHEDGRLILGEEVLTPPDSPIKITALKLSDRALEGLNTHGARIPSSTIPAAEEADEDAQVPDPEDA